MKVLVACECSGTVRDAFIGRGHDAVSCDLQPTDADGPHYVGDVCDIINDGWDLMIAHPPCTHLCVSGARWFASGHKPIKLQEDALDFVRAMMDAPIDKIAIENPISVISSKIKKPTQIIRPFQFGENSTKATCLWLKNLPKLEPTKIITPEKHTTKSGKVYDKWWFDTCLISDLKLRAKVRSKTFQGIADAMADQWGGNAKQQTL